MLARDYCEIINQSIHQIVEASTLADDGARIIPGEITARSGNTYTISYGSGVIINGQSHNGNTYQVGDQIWFLYAQGEALIQGINLTQAETPIYDLDGYEDFLKVEAHSFAEPGTWYLTTREQKYTRLGLEGTFSGDFEITIKLFTNKETYSYTITPKDLIGTIAGITSLPLLHRKGLVINLDTITAVEVVWGDQLKLPDDESIKISLGNELNTQNLGAILSIDDPELLKYKTKHNGSNLIYSEPTETGKRTLHLQWVAEEGGVRKGYSQLNAADTPAGAEIRWYRWRADYQGGDDIIGLNSHWLLERRCLVEQGADTSNWYTYEVELAKDVAQDRFKVAILYGANQYTISNEITFTNEQEPIPEIKTSIGIVAADFERNGVIPYFGFDKLIKAELAYKALQPHKLTMVPNIFKSDDYTEQTFDEAIASFEWKVPSLLFNIVPSALYSVTEEAGYHIVRPSRRLENTIIETEAQTKWIGFWPKDIEVRINNNGYADYTQIVYCTVVLNTGKKLEASLSFTTPVQGIMGSNNFVFTHLYNEDGIEVQGVYVDPDLAKTYTLTVEVFDMSSEENVLQSDISAEFWNEATRIEVAEVTGNTSQGKTTSKVQLTLLFQGQHIDYIYDEAYTVIKLSGLKTKAGNPFSYFIPIARYFTADASTIHIPSKMYYDNAGQFYKSLTSQIIEGYNSSLHKLNRSQSTELLAISGNTIQSPTRLDFYYDINRHWDTELAPFYFNIIVTDTSNNYYQIQPVIFESVLGFSSLINDWDGSLKIDEEHNSIFSAAYVAGTKTEGKFTGSILGSLRQVIPEENNLPTTQFNTGLFGYKDSIQVYALKDDGTLTLGASGKGQISIDGSKGYIKSGNCVETGWEPTYEFNETSEQWELTPAAEIALKNSTQGTFFDLTNGKLFTGDGYFRGHIEGSTININNRFVVDKDGYMTTKAEIRSNLLAGTSDEWWTHTFPAEQKQVHLIKWKHSQTPPFAWANEAELLSKMTSDEIIYLGVSFDYEYIAQNAATQPYVKIQGYYDIVEDGTRKPFYYSLKDSVPLTSDSTTYQCKMVCSNETIKNNTYIEDIHLFVYDAAPGDTLKIRNLKVEYLPSMDTRELSPWTPGVTATEVGLIQADTLTAYVKAKDGQSSGASWNLSTSGFYVNANEANAGASNYVFKVDKDGAEINGKIIATSGTIAGWHITPGILGKLSDTAVTSQEDFASGEIKEGYKFGVALDSQASSFEKNSSILAIGALQESGEKGLYGFWTEANFRVTGKGNLYAKNANIQGHIEADTGNIGDWLIDSGLYTIDNNIDAPWIFLDPIGRSATLGEIKKDNIIFRAGSKFGVTRDGLIYSSGGQIGPLDISINGLGISSSGSDGSPSKTYIDSNSITAEYGKYSRLVQLAASSVRSYEFNISDIGTPFIIGPALTFEGDPGKLYYYTITTKGIFIVVAENNKLMLQATKLEW